MMDVIDKSAVNTGAPNLVNVCIDGNEKDEITGRLYSRYSEKPIPFDNMNCLLIQMDRLMDWIDFPQSYTKERKFSDTSGSICPAEEKVGGMSDKTDRIDARWHAKANREGRRMKTTDEILSEAGKKATFVVNVQYRQNATWQGKVLWAETGRSRYFRSALELVKLIDGALDEAQMEGSKENL